ncbi:MULTISPECIES: hypothetical protein [Pseudomonadota]|uniref:hypothetical protein n=1 Tax=Pseudomonadota TaxID=1224 RepID=UPI004038173D
MKQGVVFVLASAALLSAVVTAHVMAPLPEGGPFQASAKAATASESPPVAARPVVDTVATKPMIQVRQAPVPLQMRERPPVILPASLETAAATMPASSMPADVEGGSFARSAIEADGYRAVKNIVPGPDGTWRARALRGRTEVVVTVDRDGRVSTE